MRTKSFSQDRLPAHSPGGKKKRYRNRFTYPNTRYTEAIPTVVTNVTGPNPAVVSAPGHRFSDGDRVVFAGMTHSAAVA